MPRTITAFSNPLVKRIQGLRDKRHRREEGLFLAEGLRILTEARETGRLPQFLFFAAASARHPQAVVGAFPTFDTALDRLDRTTSPIWLVAERLRDPGNLGTILRTGDAVGAGGLILIGDSVDPFSTEAVRASMGALFTVPLVRTEWDTFLPWLRSGPGQLVGLSLRTESHYRTATYAAPTFLLTGNEAQGLPAAIERECDLLVKMPMLGKADSLNAAVATAVMAYEVLAHHGPRQGPTA
jgi:TrmH family RNA methyltransferase